MEHRRPAKVRLADGSLVSAKDLKHYASVGMLLMGQELSAEMIQRALDASDGGTSLAVEDESPPRAIASGMSSTLEYLLPRLVRGEFGKKPMPKWALHSATFVEDQDDKNKVFGPLEMWSFLLDADGATVGVPVGGPVLEPTVPVEALPQLTHLLYPALFAVTFMHCKNVRVRDEGPPAALSKAHERRRGRPLVKYKVLEIDPMRAILEGARTGEPGAPPPLHICRGHFKRFEGKGLFGKHKGLYWWGQHVRGSAARGVVIKDYAVKDASAASAESSEPNGSR